MPNREGLAGPIVDRYSCDATIQWRVMSQRIAYSQVAPDAVKSLSATRTYLAAAGFDPRLRALVELRY